MQSTFTTTLDIPFDDVLMKVRDALAEQGFGIITEIDVKATIKKKLDLDFKQYIILGACNPKFAHKALSANDDVGLLLPCNVIVYEDEEGVTVSTMKPSQMLNILHDDSLTDIAEGAEMALAKAFTQLLS